jgi:zona occludens toxin (predicted ATPase)
MKLAAVLILALACSACTAKTPHVTTAFLLYKSCAQGTLQSTHQPKTLAEVREILDHIDSMCLDWALAWYPAFVDPKDDSPDLTQAEADRFQALRMNTRQQLFEYLSEFVPKSVKKK